MATGVVELSIRRASIVIDGDAVRVLESAGGLNFLLEASHRVLSGTVDREELDGCRSTEQNVGGLVDDAHPSLAKFSLQLVLAETSGIVHLLSGDRRSPMRSRS
jgi:hypothetical protein